MVTKQKRNPLDEYCELEWDLLCWIRREIKIIRKLTSTKLSLEILLDSIILAMNGRFDDWPEEPK